MTCSGIVTNALKTTLPYANVTAPSFCTPRTQVTGDDGVFAIECAGSDAVDLVVWARQYLTVSKVGALIFGHTGKRRVQ